MALTLTILNPDNSEQSNLEGFQFNILQNGSVIDTALSDASGSITFQNVDPSQTGLTMALDVSFYEEIQQQLSTDIPVWTPDTPGDGLGMDANKSAKDTPFGPNWVDENIAYYYVTFFSVTGESSKSPIFSFKIEEFGCPYLTGIPTADVSSIPKGQVVGRNIYRAFAHTKISNQISDYELVAIINDNTTTTFQDFLV